MKLTFLKFTLFTICCTALVPQVKAQVNYQTGDLLVGFDNSTSNEDYVVDLGQYTKFIASGSYATGSPVTLLSGTAFANDLLSAGVSAGSFGVFGTTSPTSSIYFGTAMEPTPGVQSTPQQALKTTSAGNANSPLKGEAAGFSSGLDQLNSPPSQTLGTVPNSVIQVVNTSNSAQPNVAINNYQMYVGTPSNPNSVAFGFFQQSFEGQYGSSYNGGLGAGTSDVLDLYEFTPGATTAASHTTLLGEFQMNNGQLTFDSAAIPEPSAFAALLSGVGVIALRRRRSSLR